MLQDEQQLEELQMEIELMRRLAGHPYIVEAQAVYEDEKSVHVDMELCMGGDLFDLLSRQDHLAEPEACRLFRFGPDLQNLLHCFALFVHQGHVASPAACRLPSLLSAH